MLPTKPSKIPMDTRSVWKPDLLAQTFSAMGEAVYCWYIPSGQLQWSEGAAKILGTTGKDIPCLVTDMQRRIAPDDIPARAIALSGLFYEGVSCTCEFTLRRRRWL